MCKHMRHLNEFVEEGGKSPRAEMEIMKFYSRLSAIFSYEYIAECLYTLFVCKKEIQLFYIKRLSTEKNH